MIMFAVYVPVFLQFHIIFFKEIIILSIKDKLRYKENLSMIIYKLTEVSLLKIEFSYLRL